jgi:hypothetical protein
VVAAESTAVGPGISLYEAGIVVVHAFAAAAILAFLAIFVLLWLTLRRLSDVPGNTTGLMSCSSSPSLLCSASLIELAVLRPLNRSTSARVKFETEQVSLTNLLISAER